MAWLTSPKELVAPPKPLVKPVQCYHCHRLIEVPARALVLTCPACFQRVKIDDVHVVGTQAHARVRTCGLITVGKGASLAADLIEARLGVHVLGAVTGRVFSGGPVVIGPRATWMGDCTASRLIIYPGATILGGRFTIAHNAHTLVPAEPMSRDAIGRSG